MISISPLALRRFWLCVGWFGLALLLYLSFTPQPPDVPLENGDKFGHALAYAVLMFWWAQLLDAGRQRLLLAVGLIGVGVAIEFVQGWTGWRAFEYYDMLADAIGVAVGGALATIIPTVLKVGGKVRPR